MWFHEFSKEHISISGDLIEVNIKIRQTFWSKRMIASISQFFNIWPHEKVHLKWFYEFVSEDFC